MKMKNRKTKCPLKAVDFFCGGGGMSLGMERAGIAVVAGIDNDPMCRETYEANHPDSQFIHADIKSLPPKILGKKVGINRNDDELIFIGCSPCQYWSVITGTDYSARKQTARKNRNLLRYFMHFVSHYRPGFVVIENVRGIERDPKKSGLDGLLKFFEESGYGYHYDILSTNSFGVPQTRQRFILIASRVLDSISLPKPSEKRPNVIDVIGGKKRLPPIKPGECDSRDKLHKSPSLSAINIKRLKLTPEGGIRKHWHHRDDLQIDAYRNKSTSFFRENYGRMAWNKPAPTITTKFFAIACGRFGHPEETRAISLREGALLQTFPKSYKFKTSDFTNTARIIGNAVPPEFAKRIGRSIFKQWLTYSTRKNAPG